MATKAERFRAEAQVENSSRKPRASLAPARPKATATPKPHNLSEHAARSARVSYEVSETRPSRKSTRGSAHHQRAASQLERTEQLKQRSPKTRATIARARAVKTRGKR
jgi:hypothetical protein